MNGTIIQKGQATSTKEFLLNTPIPFQTNTYKPVTYAKLIDTTLEALDRSGFELKNEIYRQSAGGLKANGMYHLNYGNDKDMSLMVAWQNSYDKTLSLKFGLGTYVFLCSNGQVSADFNTFKSKHIGEVQTITPKIITEYISNAADVLTQMIREKEQLKEKEVTKRITAELLGRLFIEESIITSTQLNIIKKGNRKPFVQLWA